MGGKDPERVGGTWQFPMLGIGAKVEVNSREESCKKVTVLCLISKSHREMSQLELSLVSLPLGRGNTN